MKSNNLITFSIDEEYLPHLAVALISLIHHNDCTNLSIVVIHKNIRDSKLEEMFEFFSAKGLRISFCNVDSFLDDISVGYHFNEVIFYRFLAAELFSDFEKILYLDSDIVVTDSILDIFEIELQSSAIAAVDNTNFSGVPSHLKNFISRYLASGLLLINTHKFIEQGIKEKCIHFLRNFQFEMPDQDSLSFVAQDFVAIDPRYSVETAFLDKNDAKYDFAKNPKIIQFSGSSKPWHMNNDHPYKKLYWHYRNQTPYKTIFPSDFSFKNIIIYFTPRVVKKLILTFLKRKNK